MEATQRAANMYLEEIREIRRETKEKCIHTLEFTGQKSNEYLQDKDKYRRFD